MFSIRTSWRINVIRGSQPSIPSVSSARVDLPVKLMSLRALSVRIHVSQKRESLHCRRIEGKSVMLEQHRGCFPRDLAIDVKD